MCLISWEAGNMKPLLWSSETVEATVAFIDICSFTSISEKETPDTVVATAEQVF